MTQATKPTSPLRQRMLEDMALRRFSPKTQHEDIRVIQVLLGHKQLNNTATYSHVAASLLQRVKGPLEYLDLPPPG
jgi:integrase